LASQLGCRKTNMRCRRHATMNSRAMSPGSIAAIPANRYFHSMPASTNTMAVTPATTRAVPRSGCLTMRRIKTTGNDDRAQQGVLQIAHFVQPRMEKPGEKQHQHGFRDLRRLKGEVPSKANPAMSVVRAGK